MSGAGGVDDGGPEMLAAEYVLGTLDGAELAAAEARRGGDAGFAAEVRFWERELYPLTLLVAPVAPPEAVWARIEASTATAGVVPANDNRLGWWRASALGAAAVAAGLAVFIAVRPPMPPPMVAVLAPAGSTLAVLVVVSGPGGSLLVRPSGAVTVAAGKDLQLWALAAGATKPASLGVLPAGGRTVAGVAAGTQLLVSLEPKGGSPTGLPTGPVVYGGLLQR